MQADPTIQKIDNNIIPRSSGNARRYGMVPAHIPVFVIPGIEYLQGLLTKDGIVACNTILSVESAF